MKGVAIMVAIYYGATAEEQLAAAQQALVEHATGIDGRCRRCGTKGPCYKRETAVSIFSRSLRLPCRRPGASQPELLGVAAAVPVGTRGGATFRWLR